MAKKSMLAKALGLGRREDAAPSEQPDSELDAIFAAIRSGEVPWTPDELPADARHATKLLFELDRLWLRPQS